MKFLENVQWIQRLNLIVYIVFILCLETWYHVMSLSSMIIVLQSFFWVCSDDWIHWFWKFNWNTETEIFIACWSWWIDSYEILSKSSGICYLESRFDSRMWDVYMGYYHWVRILIALITIQLPKSVVVCIKWFYF